MKIAAWRKSSMAKKYPVWEVLIVATATALVNYPIVFMRFLFSSLLYLHC
jgi:chloride channel 3/4/5